MASSTAVFNPDSEGTFPLSKIAFFHASLTKMNWITMNIKKEISTFGFRYIFFNSKQIKSVLNLIPKVDAVLRNFNPEKDKDNESIEIPTPKGDKRLIIFSHKRRFFVEVCTFATPQTLESSATMKPPFKRSKNEDLPMVKVKGQSITLTMNEWCALKEKSAEILVHISNLELGITPSDSEVIARELSSQIDTDVEGDVVTQVPVFTWRSFNDKSGLFEQSPQAFFVERQCLEEGAGYQALKNRKDKVLIAKKYRLAPTIDCVMRSSYVYRARLLMTKYRKRTCEGCKDRLVGVNDPKHLVGCKMGWSSNCEDVYKKIRGEIELNHVKRMASCFLQEIMCNHLIYAIDVYEIEYDEELMAAIFNDKDEFEEMISDTMSYITAKTNKNDFMDFSDSDSDGDNIDM
jgi:hypothetical protein